MRTTWRRGSALWSGGYAWFLSSRSSREAAAYHLPCEPVLFPSNNEFPSKLTQLIRKIQKFDRMKASFHWVNIDILTKKRMVEEHVTFWFRVFILPDKELNEQTKSHLREKSDFFLNAWWRNGCINVNLDHLLIPPDLAHLVHAPITCRSQGKLEKAIKSNVFPCPKLFRNYPSNLDKIW